MVESYSFTSINPGQNTLILGSIHGDEVCGSIAIDRVINEIRLGVIEIIKGSVTFIPRANAIAFKKGIRQDCYNLNRIFGPREIISSEHMIAKIIETYIQQSSFVLDLHSTHTHDDPFIILESNGVVAKKFVDESPFQNILLDWEKLYGESESMDTIAYASSKSIPGVTIECGEHQSPSSIDNALQAIYFALGYFGHINNQTKSYFSGIKMRVSVKEIIHRPSMAKFSKTWRNFDTIQKGELIGTSEDGNHIAPYAGHIIIPKPEGFVGEEWYYLGI